MAKFKFKFDSVARIKEVFEKKIQKELFLIEKEIADLKNQQLLIESERNELRGEMEKKSQNVYEYKNLKNYDLNLQARIEAVEKIILQTVEKRNLKMEELIQKKKEIKTLEILKEHQQEQFLIESNRAEMKDINEIAINNFNRNTQ